MNDSAMTNVLLVALLCSCAALLYLDWRRQGETELLHERVDRLEAVGFVRTITVESREPAPTELLREEV
jgi:hypothetical protein